MRRYPSNAAIAAPNFCILWPLHCASREKGLCVTFRFDHPVACNCAILVDAVHLVSSHQLLKPPPGNGEHNSRKLTFAVTFRKGCLGFAADRSARLPLSQRMQAFGSSGCAIALGGSSRDL